jgi:hypothetical protein
MIVPTPDGFTTRPVGLDFTAVMLTGAAAGVDLPMLAAVLPLIEGSVINPSDGFEEEGDDDDDDA